MDENLKHHRRHEYCNTRLKYRQGKSPTAVKVYTVANESTHLLIFGIPKINLQNEVKRLLYKYGPLDLLRCVTDEVHKNSDQHLVEQFTDVFHAHFNKLEHARRAKKFLDARNFYGGILHISYAAEYENLNELRCKLQKRKMEVQYRINLNQSNYNKSLSEKRLEKV